jgi:hypothetical protein
MDWMKALGHLHTATTAAVKLKQGYDNVTTLNELLALDRDGAMARLGQQVSQMQSQQFDEFEVAFVNFAVAVPDYKQRIKALELYAWLKVLELEKFGQWRGFVQWA